MVNSGDPLPKTSDGIIRVEATEERTFFWHPIDTTDAYHLESYGYLEPTMFDSTEAGWEYTYYQVIAHTHDDLVFYISTLMP